MSSVLSGSALSPALVSQSRHAAYPSLIVVSTFSQVSPQAKMTPSSMYILREALVQLLIFRRSAAV